ncbi:hypothetical protein [Gimesia fumaroli]|uniref:Uncharacterized protein n=1 Tax=Gimesia fumaroli TaxID=2527976 RepID=A0A518I7H7_9PLAN|nr:hypothetical protein [Gimesia fumaroli]QDV49048.1 hypothetical protein Enr17x_10630 [Gimesia fumaroli]
MLNWFKIKNIKELILVILFVGFLVWTIVLFQDDDFSIPRLGLAGAGQSKGQLGVSAVLHMGGPVEREEQYAKEMGTLDLINGTETQFKIYGIGHRCSCVEFSDLPFTVNSNQTKSISLKAPVNYFKRGEEQKLVLFCSDYGKIPLTVFVE